MYGGQCLSRAVSKLSLHRRSVGDHLLEPCRSFVASLPWRQRNAVKQRWTARDLACTSTTQSLPETRRAENGVTRTGRFSGTLIALPSELLSDFKFWTPSNHFLMLTQETGFDLEAPGDMAVTLSTHSDPDCTVTLSESQMETISAFKKTPVYQLMFRLCEDKLLKSEFWRKVTFLPCRVTQEGSWDVAWDLIEPLIGGHGRAAYQEFVKTFRTSWLENEDPDQALVDAIRQIQDLFPLDFPPVSDSVSWDDVGEFLKCCATFAPGQWPAVGLNLEAVKPKMHITGFRVSPCFTTHETLKENLETREIVRLTVNRDALFPLPASWLVSFLAMQGLVPGIVQIVDAERLRRAFNLPDTLPMMPFAQALAGQDRKSIALGSLVLRLLTLLNRWQGSKDCRLHNSRAASVSSQDEIRNVSLGATLLKFPSIAQVLNNWIGFRTVDDTLITSAFPDAEEWCHILAEERLELELDPASVVFYNQTASLGYNFKPTVACVYDALGFEAAWSMCEKIGLVEMQKGGMLWQYVHRWRTDGAAGQIQEWELCHIDKAFAVLFDIYEEFCEDFGYVFHQKYRFDWAMYHPSTQVAKAAPYGWSLVIGKAILDLLIQEHISRAHPEMEQNDINGIFNDQTRQRICFNVAINLKLHRIGITSMRPDVRYLAQHHQDKAALEHDNSVRNYITNLMMALITCLAWDMGLELDRVLETLRPHFAEEIDAYTDRKQPLYYTLNQYVPKLMEKTHFHKTHLKAEAYFSSLIQLMRSDSREVIFGIHVLTKKALPKFDDVSVYHFVDELDLNLRMQPSKEVLHIDPDKHAMLNQFQSDYFVPILLPETEAVKSGHQTKKYLVAPTVGSTDVIDWDLVQHVVQKTLPADFYNLLAHLNGNAVDVAASAEAILSMDAACAFHKNSVTGSDPVSGFQKLLFMTDLQQVVRVENGMELSGAVLNTQCLTDISPAPRRSRLGVKTIEFDPSACQCLPYTYSYFRCLACVPYLLEILEQRLLAEDYRQAYNLPNSIPTDDLVQALTADSNVYGFQLNRLEAVGHSVMRYLYTIELVMQHPDVLVGRLSVMRTVKENAKEMAAREDVDYILGNSMPPHFAPYRPGQTWYPPASAPFVLQSIHNESEPEAQETPEGLKVHPVKNRVLSGKIQNTGCGIPLKQFRAMTGLCFLHGGIKAACTYLHRIGAVELQQYPSLKSKSVQGKPRLNKYAKLEKILDYQFRNEETLALAFMHSSVFPKIGENNEILEFLGDAALDLCMWRYVHVTYPEIHVSEAALLKMELTRNKIFGWVSASPPLELPNLLMQSVEGFSEGLDPTKRSKLGGFEDSSVGKTASDVFEALHGAILIDSGYSIETVSTVMLKLMKEVLSDVKQFGIKEPDRT